MLFYIGMCYYRQHTPLIGDRSWWTEKRIDLQRHNQNLLEDQGVVVGAAFVTVSLANLSVMDNSSLAWTLSE